MRSEFPFEHIITGKKILLFTGKQRKTATIIEIDDVEYAIVNRLRYFVRCDIA